MQQDELKNENIGRVLHGLFATAIVCQLFSSFTMKTPAFSRFIGLAQGDAFFLHKTIGLLAFAFVVCYWIWVFKWRRDKLRHLFPWRRQDFVIIFADIRCLLRRQLVRHESGGLAGFVHGLGLLLVTLVGLCGVYLYIFLPQKNIMPAVLHFIKETHGNFAYFIWWYAIGHTLMAIWHYFRERRKPN